MASTTPNTTEQNDTAPVFAIQRIYLKDCSLEQPNAPQILLESGQPEVEVQLGVNAQDIKDGQFFEVSIKVNVHAKMQEKTLFLVEATQAGIFEIRNIPQEHLGAVLNGNCPQILFPYLRAQIADAIGKASFTPIHLDEVNFQALYQNSLAESAAKAPATANA